MMLILPMVAENWEIARLTISRGQLVTFPTDTVYGVGCDPFNTSAIKKLYDAKGRDRTKALPLLLSSPERLSIATSHLPSSALILGREFWPGALTLVVPRKEDLPMELGGDDTIAVRVPNHADLRSFIESCGGALATSSANLSGEPDALNAQAAAAYLGSSVGVIIDGGPTTGGIPSTVIDCTYEPARILREGAISRENIEAVLRMERAIGGTQD